MLPNAIANTGPYASLWSHLRTLRHALERTGADQKVERLTDLDIDRLLALKEFLQTALDPTDSGVISSEENRTNLEPIRIPYGFAMDLRSRIVGLDAFSRWKEASKIGYEKKMQGLIHAIDRYLEEVKPRLITVNFPTEEHAVLTCLLDRLLADAEMSLEESAY